MAVFARPFTAEDRPAFARLCARDPLRFLTARLHVGPQERSGPPLRLWGAFTADGREMLGLLTCLNSTIIVTDGDGACAHAFAAVIDAEREIAGVRGTREVVRKIQALLQCYRPTDWEESLFMRLTHSPHCPPETLALAPDNTIGYAILTSATASGISANGVLDLNPSSTSGYYAQYTQTAGTLTNNGNITVVTSVSAVTSKLLGNVDNLGTVEVNGLLNTSSGTFTDDTGSTWAIATGITMTANNSVSNSAGTIAVTGTGQLVVACSCT